MTKHVIPSVKETTFNCPHCGALTTQYWYDLYVDQRKDNSTHSLLREGNEHYEEVIKMPSASNDDLKEEHAIFIESIKRQAKGLPFFDKSSTSYYQTILQNVHL